MSSEFTIGLHLKPYVKRYLINNFGDPVNLYCVEGQDLKELMIQFLKKSCRKNDKRIKLTTLNKETRIRISESDFYRYGWEISKTDMLKFNNRIESLIKFYARCFIAFDKSFGVPISISIRSFQDEYGFSEEDFPYETIKKDFDRNGHYIKFDKFSTFKTSLREIFMEQLSDFRQIV